MKTKSIAKVGQFIWPSLTGIEGTIVKINIKKSKRKPKQGTRRGKSGMRE